MTAFVKEEVKSVELTSYQKPNKSLPSLTIDFIDYFLDYMDKKVNIQTLMANGFVSVPKEISRKIVQT